MVCVGWRGLLVAAALRACACTGPRPALAAAPPREGLPLFRKGDLGFDSFRGTVLLQEVGTPWLIAFACGRKGGGDASGRTLFVRRSADGGASWDPPRVWATASNASLLAGDGVYVGSDRPRSPSTARARARCQRVPVRVAGCGLTSPSLWQPTSSPVPPAANAAPRARARARIRSTSTLTGRAGPRRGGSLCATGVRPGRAGTWEARSTTPRRTRA